ncbi:MAG: ParB/RepB/Spo0J family partition protein [Bacteroidales bacterium]|nr:ParB/RepB/Spo0J family partition protein [Bacteroidales bacterium]MBN2818409.1 ParB/RepB/Spo0J family partition protein [Bacteroidales bacterium]
MTKKNSLGRGLGALIESQETEPRKVGMPVAPKINGGVSEIDVELIDANPYQPRTIFDEETLNELASSIKEIGIIQPITLKEVEGGRYLLISGERRLRASKIAGLTKLPAYIRKANDQNMLEMALIENIQREDLDAIEVAISYQRLIDECDLTQELLSKRVGKKRATVTNYMRLLKLPAEIQLGIKEKKISMGHARALVNIEKPQEQLKIFYKVVDQDLSVRKVEELVRTRNMPKEEEKPKEPKSLKDYDSLKTDLSKLFQANIDFKRSNNGDGKIVIPFKSDEDLERLIAIFDKLNIK